MRDLLVTAIIFGSLPFIVARPWLGILMWSWISYMNPHRLAWGFAYDMPFAAMVAVATFVGLLFSKDTRQPVPRSSVLVIWVLFVLWMNLTTLFALTPDDAWAEWNRTMKIQLFALLSLWIMQGRQRIDALVWVIALSLGFFGVKGGLFALKTAGAYKVFGPEQSFISDNNSLALALVVVLPLMRYLHVTATRKWVRNGLLASMLLTGGAILASQSRGAFLAAVAMMAFLVWKSRRRVWLGIAVLVIVPLMIFAMPQSWSDRMWTIRDYQQDTSAEGRINAWYFAVNLAADRPVIGGGFAVFRPDLFVKYAPNPNDFHDSHSIYFEALAEQGYVGLGLFLLLGVMAFRAAGKVVTQIDRGGAATAPLQWARELSAMLQVSLVGYAVGGTFLGLAYFDLPYHIVALMLLVRDAVRKALEQGAGGAAMENLPDGNVRSSYLDAPGHRPT